jgi:hypothetical protein
MFLHWLVVAVVDVQRICVWNVKNFWMAPDQTSLLLPEVSDVKAASSLWNNINEV